MIRWHDVRALGFWPWVWRVGYEGRKRLGLLGRPAGIDPDDPAAVLGAFRIPLRTEQELLDYFRAGGRGRFFFDPAQREAMAREMDAQGATESILAAAEEVCRRRFHFMGRTFDFGAGEINWHLDLDSGRSWPDGPWDRVDIRSDRRLGDVKFTWELNRHQFWPTLGRAYWLTGDDRYAREWVDQFHGWCHQNPPERGVNWVSNLEHAVRIVSWWTSARLMLASPAVAPQTLRRLIGMLIAKARHILSDLAYSRVNMANNHLLGDAMGLALLGGAIPELAEAPRWRRVGLSILTRQARRQIHADGSSIECSAGYHRFALQFYLLALAQARGAEPAGAAWRVMRNRVAKMAAFLAAVVRPNGTAPPFGDFDNGLAYRLNEAPVTDYRPVLSTAAVLLGRGDLKRAAGRLDPETLWLLGPAAAGEFRALDDSTPAPRRRAFARGGYFLARTGRDEAHLFVQNGAFTSHTHADLLSLALHADDRDVLVDAGTLTYNGDWGWRTYFRSTRAHNTVTVDAQGQAPAHRAFRWLGRPRGRNLWFADEGRFVFDGLHHGYRPLGVTHRRVLIGLDARSWLCLDVLTGSGWHEAGVHWHPAADLEAEQAGDLIAVARRGGKDVLSLSAAAEGPLGVALVRGVLPQRQVYPIGPAELAGWWSPEYGVKQPAWEITFTARGPMPLAVATVLDLGPPRWRPAAPMRNGGTLRVYLTPVGEGAPEPGAGEIVRVEYYLDAAGAAGPGRVAEVGEIAWPDRDRREPIRARRLGASV